MGEITVTRRKVEAAKLPEARVRAYLGSVTAWAASMSDADAAWLGLSAGQGVDSGNMTAAARMLTYVEEELFRSPSPPLGSERVVPRKTGAGGWVRETAFNVLTGSAEMTVVSGAATDYPLVSAAISENTSAVRPYGNAYAYFLREVLAAARMNMNLDAEKAQLCMDGYEETVDRLAWEGDEAYRIKGLKSYLGSESDTGKIAVYRSATAFSSLSDTQILDLLGGLFRKAAKRVKYNTVLLPNTLALPHRLRDYLAERPFGTGNGEMSLLKYFLTNSPYCNNVVAWNRLLEAGDTLGGAASDVLLALPVTPRALRQQIPDPFRPAQPEQSKGQVVVNCEALIGSVEVIAPGAMACQMVPGTGL